MLVYDNSSVKTLIRICAFVALFVALLLTMSTGIGAEQPKELTVFCAAGLMGAFNELGQIYKNETGVGLAFNFDGAQVLRTQIENGAYADVLVVPNEKNLNVLKNEGVLNNSSISPFARSWQALIVPKSNPAQIQNLSDLAKPGVKIVGGVKDLPITNITMQVLDKISADPTYGPQYKERVLSNVISQETNVNQIVAKIAIGEADAAFVHKSEVSAEYFDKVAVIDIPEKYNVKSDYSIAILNQTKFSETAKRFIDLVKSKEGNAILVKYGYEVV